MRTAASHSTPSRTICANSMFTPGGLLLAWRRSPPTLPTLEPAAALAGGPPRMTQAHRDPCSVEGRVEYELNNCSHSVICIFMSCALIVGKSTFIWASESPNRQVHSRSTLSEDGHKLSHGSGCSIWPGDTNREEVEISAETHAFRVIPRTSTPALRGERPWTLSGHPHNGTPKPLLTASLLGSIFLATGRLPHPFIHSTAFIILVHRI